MFIGGILISMLTKKQHELLSTIISYDVRQGKKIFNKRDNTFLQSNRGIAKVLRIPASNVDRLFRVAIEKGLIKLVDDNQGITRPMLNPAFIWYNNKLEKPLALFMFKLGSYQKAIDWRNTCTNLGLLIDPLTGESKGFYNWKNVDDYAQSYDAWDVNYRKEDIMFSELL